MRKNYKERFFIDSKVNIGNQSQLYIISILIIIQKGVLEYGIITVKRQIDYIWRVENWQKVY